MNASQAATFFQAALQQFQAGDHAAAELELRRCIAIDPKHTLAHLRLGVLLMSRNAVQDAEPILVRAVQLHPTLDSVTALATLFENTGRSAQAEALFKDIVKSVPNHAPTWARLGAIADRKPDRPTARDCYRRAAEADPADLSSLLRYAILSWDDNPTETVAILDRVLKDPKSTDDIRTKVLTGLLLYKEFHERRQRGLMPYHATSLDELFFTFCAEEFALLRTLVLRDAAARPNDVGVLLRKFLVLFCSRDRGGAQAVLDVLQPHLKGQIWETLSFDPGFYRRLEAMSDTDMIRSLPPVSELLSSTFADEHIAFLSCNYAYFAAFAVPMIRSLAHVSPGAQLHVHIMDGSDAELAGALDLCRSLTTLKIALTAETTGLAKTDKMAARCYYHAVRFIRYHDLIRRYQRTVWLMDVDALFHRDPHEMYKVLADKDAAFRIRAGRFEPWNQFNACIVAASPKPASLAYFRLIAAYIAHFHQRNTLRWGIDQLAMYGAFEYMRDEGKAPSLAFLDDRAIDYDYLEDGIVWCNSGAAKFQQLNRNPDGSLIIDDPVRAKYVRLFDHYARAPRPAGA
jgi:Tfp pilus assembly protein PilF